jgi:YYY domain-containing protein
MFGPFLLIGAAFLTTLMIRAVRQRRLSAAGVLLGIFGGGVGLVVGAGILTALASVAVVAVFSGVRQIVSDWTGVLESQGVSLSQVIIERLSNFGTPLLIGIGLAAIGLLARAMTGRASHAHDEESRLTREESAPFALMLLFVGALLTFAVEYVYLLDFFGTRMNTAFKLYYQTWALWGVASAYAVYYLLQSSERLRNVASRAIFGIVLAICVAAGLVYPLFTIRDKVDLSRPPTLDARAPTREFSPDEVAAIDWLDRTAVGLPVILEAEGQEYRDYTSRLSAWTGLPSVLGWSGHEGQWRGNYQEAAPRQADIDKIYATNDPATASSLLRKYDVAYVYVGPNERQKYPADGLAKFDQMLEVAFQQGNATIYRVRDGIEAREAVAK